MLIEKLQTIEDKYNELTAFLSDPEVFSDFSKYQKYSKEQANIADIVKKFREYKKILVDIKEAEEILSTGKDGLTETGSGLARPSVSMAGQG